MEYIFMFISVWILLFAEGIFQGLLGISLYSIVFLISAKRGNFLAVLLVFLPVGLALDFILFLPIGTNWILSILIYFGYLFIERIFQGVSGISLFITSFIIFVFYYLFRSFVILIVEGGSFVEYIKWDMIGLAFLSGLISAFIFVAIRAFIDLIAKPKERVLKLK